MPSARRIRRPRASLSPPSETRRVDRLSHELGQQLGQSGPGQRVDVAVGGEHEDARRAELAREEPQEQQRGNVGRVKIVEDEHDRPALARRCAGTRAVASNRRKRAPSDSSGGGSREIGEALAQLGHHLGELARRPTPRCGAQRGRIRVAHVAAQRLHPGPVGGRAARLPAAADEHARAARSSRARPARRRAGSCRCRARRRSETRRPRPASASSRPATSSASSGARPTNAPRAAPRPAARRAGARSSRGSWRRIDCVQLAQLVGPGSIPSSVDQQLRARRRYASSASAWRPQRYSASISWPRRRSRSGCVARQLPPARRSSSAWRPSARSASMRCLERRQRAAPRGARSPPRANGK